MRVGTLAFATTQGLGILAKSFYDAGIITDVLCIHHSGHTNHPEWYPDSKTITQKDHFREACAFAKEMDAIIFFETPFYWKLIPYCRDVKTTTILMPMYECTRHPNPYIADKFLCPSLLDLQYYPNGQYIPVPVDVPWRLRTEAKAFIHNAGNGSIRSRNGTNELVEAMRLVKSDVKLILRAQNNHAIKGMPAVGENIELRIDNVPHEKLWDEGDVFVFPEKWNGLSLPLQEARAAGMLVMASNRFPSSSWLPNEPLVPVAGVNRLGVFGGAPAIDEAIIRPESIAAKIDEWYGKDITKYSNAGKAWAEEMTWDKLRGKYEDFIRS